MKSTSGIFNYSLVGTTHCSRQRCNIYCIDISKLLMLLINTEEFENAHLPIPPRHDLKNRYH